MPRRNAPARNRGLRPRPHGGLDVPRLMRTLRDERRVAEAHASVGRWRKSGGDHDRRGSAARGEQWPRGARD